MAWSFVVVVIVVVVVVVVHNPNAKRHNFFPRPWEHGELVNGFDGSVPGIKLDPFETK